jgi:23S rRNA pseudouridine1911/1915/1917 synthase
MLRGFKRQALHAIQLSLTHPTTQEVMTWKVPLPEDFQKLIAEMKADLAIHDMPEKW